MYRLLLLLSTSLFFFITTTTAAACSTASASLPKPTLLPGIANPFYPCGADQISVDACPYRCYSTKASLNYTNATLLNACFTETQASALIATLTHVCVRCLVPPATQRPNSLSNKPTCQPVSNYFNTTWPATPPAKCGTLVQPLPECAWICGAAQVPFSLCDSQNTTSTYRSCQRCLPQCSSPAVVFEPPVLPSNFSLSSGSCSNQYGPQAGVLCPFRCTDPSSAGDSYCSLQNLNGTGEGFQVCHRCT